MTTKPLTTDDLAAMILERDAALARAEAAEAERDEAEKQRKIAVELFNAGLRSTSRDLNPVVEERDVLRSRVDELDELCEAAEAREAGLRTDAAAVLLAINEARMLDAALVLRRMARAAAPAKGDRTLPQDWRERVLRDALERIAKCGPGSVDGECEDCDSECIEQANIAQVALAETAPAKGDGK